MALTKFERRSRIRKRIRKKNSGTTNQPRLCVFRSNKQIYAQVINDQEGITLASASSLDKSVTEKKGVTKIEQAKLVGKLIAEKSMKAGISAVVFDRSGYLYHGRIKSLGDAAREGGLKF